MEDKFLALGGYDFEVYEDGDERPIRPPEYFEDENWDAQRQRPKTLGEAKVALAARIADPKAPDGKESIGAYDHLEA